MHDKLFTALDYTYKVFSLDNLNRQNEREMFKDTFRVLKCFYKKCQTSEEHLFFESISNNVLFKYYISEGMNELNILTKKAEYIRDITQAVMNALSGNDLIDLDVLKDNFQEVLHHYGKKTCSSRFFELFSMSEETQVCNNIINFSKLHLNNSSKCAVQ